MTSCIQPNVWMKPLIQMAAMRRRFASVCSSSSPEEETTDLYDCAPISASDPLSEQQHPCAALLCCHSVQDSLLSSNSSFTRYRGILNWIIILLVLTHAHLFLENFIQHGFLIDIKKVFQHVMEDNCNWPCVSLILGANMFAITALLLERFQEKGLLSPTNAHRLHLANLALLLLFPAAVIIHGPMTSTGGAFFSLWFYTVLGMKLYSYQEANHWYRQAHLTEADKDQNGSGALKAHNEHLTYRDLYYFLLAPTLCYQRDFPCSPKVHINKLLHRLMEMVIVIQIMVGIVQQWIEPIFQRSENSFSSMDITMRVEHLVGLVAPTHFLWLLFFFLNHSFLNFCAELLRFGDRHFYGDWWNATTLITFWRNWNIPFQKWCQRHVYTQLAAKNVPSSRAELLVFLMSAAVCECIVALPLHSCRLWIFLVLVLERRELDTALMLQAWFSAKRRQLEDREPPFSLKNVAYVNLLPLLVLLPALLPSSLLKLARALKGRLAGHAAQHRVLVWLLVAVFLGDYFKGNYGNGLVWLCLLLGPPLAVITYFHDHYISFHHCYQSSSPQLISSHHLPNLHPQ